VRITQRLAGPGAHLGAGNKSLIEIPCAHRQGTCQRGSCKSFEFGVSNANTAAGSILRLNLTTRAPGGSSLLSRRAPHPHADDQVFHAGFSKSGELVLEVIACPEPDDFDQELASRVLPVAQQKIG
jgi:hypothetical protein